MIVVRAIFVVKIFHIDENREETNNHQNGNGSQIHAPSALLIEEISSNQSEIDEWNSYHLDLRVY